MLFFKNMGMWLKKENFGLLLFRFFWGAHLIIYSIHCFMNNGLLKQLGHSVTQLHFPFSEYFWGIVAAFTFIWTGLFIVLGFWFRLATIVLGFVGLIGIWPSLSWKLFLEPNLPFPLILSLLGFCFAFIGPGKFSVTK